VTSTENPPTAPGDELVPGDTDGPATNPAAAGVLTAEKSKALQKKEIG
jgi:hypothetical protein